MPLYQLSRAYAPAEIEKIEARGERITAVVPDGAQLIVITERRPNIDRMETR